MKPESFGAAVIDSMCDENLFAKYFQPADSWAVWVIAIKLLFGLALTPQEWDVARRCTGRIQPLPLVKAVIEAWWLCGRRSGKSRIEALLAVCAACFYVTSLTSPQVNARW